MREVNNNPTGNTQNIPHQTKIEKTAVTPETPVSFTACAESKQIKDLLLDPGMQSLVKTDNIKNDIAFMGANPESVDKAMAYFDNAYNNLANAKDPNAYEKAAALTGEFTKEFLQ